VLKLTCETKGRSLLATGFAALIASVVVLWGAIPGQSKELLDNPDALLGTIRDAIETKNYETFKDLVFWKDAGKIKRRIVRFQIRRGLGRPIHKISFEPFPAHGLDAAIATGKLVVNMPVTHRVRVIYDEEPINKEGKLPTSVFLVGLKDNAYRIALVVRKPGYDDDDD